jgi:hypothetical protein
VLSRDREPEVYRDASLFLIACDDRYAPKQYFDFFRIPRIEIVVAPTLDTKSAPRHVLDRLIARRDEVGLEDTDECWLVLDTDHNPEPNHRAGFITVIREAQSIGVNVALSCPCFEIWLLLHHASEQEASNLTRCGEVELAIRARVGEYNKAKLKREHYADGSAVDATLRAERLDGTVPGGDIPEAPTTRIYRILRAILSKSLPSQLPAELRKIGP